MLRYRLTLRTEAGAARKAGGKSPGFVDSVIDLLDLFYGSVVQGITAWTPKAPQLRPRAEPLARPVAEEPDVVDSHDGVERALEDAVDTAQAESRDASDSHDQPDEFVPERVPGGTSETE